MAYNQKAQKKYNDKCKIYTIKYTLSEIQTAETLDIAKEKQGITSNAYIKKAIKNQLIADGFINSDTDIPEKYTTEE